MAFAKPSVPKAGPVPTTLLGPLKWVGLGLASLLFLFFMTRGLRKREGENLGTPAWLTHDRGADVAGAARGPHVGRATSTTPRPRCCPRASRTPACISSTS